MTAGTELAGTPRTEAAGRPRVEVAGRPLTGAAGRPPAEAAGGAGTSGQTAPGRWLPTQALRRAVLFVGLLLIAAALFGRFDLVVLAAPVAFGTALSLRRRPWSVPVVDLSVNERVVAEGGTIEITVGVADPEPGGYDLAVIGLGESPWLRPRHGDRTYAALGGQRRCEVDLAALAGRWGRWWVGPAAMVATASDGLLVSDGATTGIVPVKVYPVGEPFDADLAMPRAAGLVGQHRSRLPGDGGELAGVRPFAPGDRLRRIDWRVTLRTGHLHVISTLSDRDAEVVLLLDLLHEAGRSGGVTGAPSVLDTTVRAAAAIADHYLRVGDRVSLLEYGLMARRLRPASGRRQYLTILEWLLDVRADGCPYDPVGFSMATSRLPGNALIVVLSPLLDERSAGMLARLARSGRCLVAVDTLAGVPVAASSPSLGAGEWADVAYRLWRLERDNTVSELRAHGVPVVGWAGSGSLDAVLRDIARMGSVPKAVPR